MSKPSVLLHDTLDDRREIITLLSHLSPKSVMEYLRWCCHVSWIACPDMQMASSCLRPASDYDSVLVASELGCEEARKRLRNEVMLDLATLSHNFRIDFIVYLVELQNRAKGREPTPVPVAVAAIREFQQYVRVDLPIVVG